MDTYLDFEKPIATLEKELRGLRDLSRNGGVDLGKEIASLEEKVAHLIDQTYATLTPWQKVQLSRHPMRPYTRDYIENLFPSFMELCGDRTFGEDRAIMSGIAHWPPVEPGSAPPPIEGSILILGHQKGRTTKQKIMRNFGMAKPEGYRKAIRLMEMAERLRIPVLTFIDTPGAYPGLETEERGQAQAIAECIRYMFGLTVPVVSVVIGEGGSGGALAIGIANVVLMQEYSTYSVISPEGCASIIWSDSTQAEKAAEQLRMSPADLKAMDIIDDIVPEPRGGAHRDWKGCFGLMRKSLIQHMSPLLKGNWSLPRAEIEKALLTSANIERKNRSTKSVTTAKKTTKKITKKVAMSPKPPLVADSAPHDDGLKLREERIRKFRKMGHFALAHTQESGLS